MTHQKRAEWKRHNVSGAWAIWTKGRRASLRLSLTAHRIYDPSQERVREGGAGKAHETEHELSCLAKSFSQTSHRACVGPTFLYRFKDGPMENYTQIETWVFSYKCHWPSA